MKTGRVRIADDVYFISSRLKEIDETYYVMFNTATRKYEIHSDAQKGSSLCFVVPFGELDARTVDYALRTRNADFGKLPRQKKKREEAL